jgi:HK97 family phage major capsid protein
MDQSQILAEIERGTAFMAQQALTIERLEAKLTNRPGNGGVNIETHGIESHGVGRITSAGIVYDNPEVKAFSQYMRTGKESPELKAMDITTPGDGGYGLPKQISGQIESLLLKYSPMRKLSTVEPAFTQDFHKLVSDPKTTGSAWVGEQAARVATTTPTFYDAAPPMGEIYANPQITQQALDDVFFNAEQFLIDGVTETFLSAEGAAFIGGSGVNQPKGLMTYGTSALGDDTRAVFTIQYVPSGAAAGFLASSASVSAFDVMQSCLFSMRPKYRLDAAWLCNSVTMSVLAGIKDLQGRYVLQPTQVPGFPPTILGVPVYEDQFMPAIAANSYPIALVSKRAYLIVDRMPIRSLRDPFSNKPFVGMYTTKRLGGGILNSEAVKFVKMAVS